MCFLCMPLMPIWYTTTACDLSLIVYLVFLNGKASLMRNKQLSSDVGITIVSFDNSFVKESGEAGWSYNWIEFFHPVCFCFYY